MVQWAIKTKNVHMPLALSIQFILFPIFNYYCLLLIDGFVFFNPIDYCNKNALMLLFFY